ncbi:MAG: hypothetical protein R2692_07070 [Microbacterium sp.]
MQTETPVVWQRVPQGWIELAAFANDDIADSWWQAYLAPAIGSVDSDTIALMTRAFASAREAVRDTPYAVAGIFPDLGDEPTVFFIGTAILPAPEDARTADRLGPHRSRPIHRRPAHRAVHRLGRARRIGHARHRRARGRHQRRRDHGRSAPRRIASNLDR